MTNASQIIDGEGGGGDQREMFYVNLKGSR